MSVIWLLSFPGIAVYSVKYTRDVSNATSRSYFISYVFKYDVNPFVSYLNSLGSFKLNFSMLKIHNLKQISH